MPDCPSYEFRPASTEDRPFLRELFVSSWDRAFALADWTDELREAVLNQQFDAQEQSYRTTCPGAEHTLIMVDRERVGRLYVRREAMTIGLMDITLLPVWRNRGLGTAIIQTLLREAAEARKPVQLYVEKWNPRARALYQRLGFTDLEDIQTHWRMQCAPTPQEKIDS